MLWYKLIFDILKLLLPVETQFQHSQPTTDVDNNSYLECSEKPEVTKKKSNFEPTQKQMQKIKLVDQVFHSLTGKLFWQSYKMP